MQLLGSQNDILHKDWYKLAGINVVEEELQITQFRFRHDKEVALQGKLPYLFSGHIHPGILISGMGRQSLRLPCFYFARDFCVLPAFSAFTGTWLMDRDEGENIFAIVENKIVQLQ